MRLAKKQSCLQAGSLLLQLTHTIQSQAPKSPHSACVRACTTASMRMYIHTTQCHYPHAANTCESSKERVLFNHETLCSSITKCSRYIWRHISMMRGYGQALLYGRELCAIWGTGRSGACRPPRVIPPRQPNRGKTLAMHKPPAARLYGAGVGYSWTWTSILPRSVRAISHSSVLHADAQSEEVSLHWSGSFDGKLKMLMMEATALGRELCENPTPDRQAVIGLVCSRPC